MSLLGFAEEVVKDVEGIAHYIPSPIAKEFKPILRKVGLVGLHFIIGKASPIVGPIAGIAKVAYELLPDNPKREEALKALEESGHLLWECIVDAHTEPMTDLIESDQAEA